MCWVSSDALEANFRKKYLALLTTFPIMHPCNRPNTFHFVRIWHNADFSFKEIFYNSVRIGRKYDSLRVKIIALSYGTNLTHKKDIISRGDSFSSIISNVFFFYSFTIPLFWLAWGRNHGSRRSEWQRKVFFAPFLSVLTQVLISFEGKFYNEEIKCDFLKVGYFWNKSQL